MSARSCGGFFEQLIQQTQQLVYTTSQPNNRIRLDFNHCLIELIWAVRKASVVAGVDRQLRGYYGAHHVG